MFAEKLFEAKRLTELALQIHKNPDSSQEEKNKVVGYIEEAKKLKAEAEQIKEIEAFAAQVNDATKDAPAPGEKGGNVIDAGSQFKTWGSFLTAIASWSISGKRDARLKAFQDVDEPAEKKDMAESVGATGGFLVPEEFQAQLLGVMGENSILRSRATRIRMTRRQINIPVLDQTGTTAGIPHWFGGMRAYWQEEASQKQASDPTFRRLSLVANKLIMYTRSSDELLDDSAISLQDFLSGPMGFSGAITWMEDFAFLNGTGAGQPLGILNSPATITVARQAQGAVTFTDLVNMVSSFLPSGNGLWLLSQSVLARLMLMEGPAGNASYLWGNAVNGAPGTILGYPYIVTEKLPRMSATSNGDVLLIDPKYYVIGDRQATTVESTKFDRWQYDQTSWRAVHRVDGQPWLSSPLVYQDGTTEVSPFVMLGAKAS